VTASSSRIPVLAKRGIYLPECGLWLDPWERQECAFVSHAHADHFAAHGTIIASKGTAKLIEARFRGAYTLEPHMFGRAWTWRGHRLMLLPAGHTLGSAQIHVTRLSDGASLLYTGDFKLRGARTAESARMVPADTLIMETTFGLPKFRFPSTTKVRNAVIRFCRECLEEGEVPVLVAYALGKAQELMAQLGEAGFSWVLHPACFEMTVAYEAQGMRFPPYEPLAEGVDPAGKVLLVPPSAARSQAVRRIRSRRLAMCTGWALTPGAKFRYQVDEVFPLSDHADYGELLAAVDQVKPKLVLTTHGYASEFACDLRERGQEAWSLGADDQMEFSFGLRGGMGEDGPEEGDEEAGEAGAGRAAAEDAEPDAVSGSEFAAFVRIGDAVSATAGRLAKIDSLAAYFRGLGDETKVATAARFLSGRAVATREQQKALATGWAVIRLALLNATGIGAARFREISASQADAGRTAYLALLHGQKAIPREMALADITACVDRLVGARGSMAKAAVLETYFRQMTPAEGQYLVKILTGDMRIGLKDGLIEEALAAAFAADPASVREAHMLTGDLGETARLASRGELESACLTLFQPLQPMLASPEASAIDIWERLTGSPPEEGSTDAGPATPSATLAEPAVWLEDKFDGIRAQLHKRGPRVDVYSRDLRSLEAEFPDIAGPAARLPDDLVLDGEIIAFAEGRRLDFQSLQKRLGRRERDLFMNDDVPVRFVVFDLLYHNGESLLLRPLAERRARLESLALTAPFELIARLSAGSPLAIEAAFLAARARGNEGLIAKDPSSPYTAGRRGRSWLKLKKAMATLDCVVVAAQQGHGRRSHVLSDYTFAVRDERDGSLKVLGKAYSGLTDAEIEELTAHFTAQTLEESRRTRRVVPDTVLEIAFDAIQPSDRHDSGLALRFPRIKAIRRDKTVADIDTLGTARKLAGLDDPGQTLTGGG
jgi:DNA ligase-1